MQMKRSVSYLMVSMTVACAAQQRAPIEGESDEPSVAELSSALFNQPGCLSASSSSGFAGFDIPAQNGVFVVTFDAEVGSAASDVVIGLSNGAATAFRQFATTARFFSNNRIDSFNATAYSAVNTVAYTAATRYRFTMQVDVPRQRFSLSARAPGGSDVVVANDYAFRAVAGTIAQLNRINVKVDAGGAAQLCNVTVSQPSCLAANSDSGFVGLDVPAQAAKFTATFDAEVTGAASDVVIGLSNRAATRFGDFATTARFFTNNNIDSFNGSAYTAANTVPYAPNTRYRFRMRVDVAAQRFSLTATPPGGAEATVADNYAFRTAAGTIAQLTRLNMKVDNAGGAAQVCGLEITADTTTPPPASPPPPAPAPAPAGSVTVTLTRASGITGTQRVNLGLPLRPGQLTDATLAAVRIDGTVVSTGRRALARYADNSIRSLQVQFDAPASATSATITLGETAPALSLVSVDSTLRADTVGSAAVQSPRVWATLPASWLAKSDVTGHVLEASAVPTGSLHAWVDICDYDDWNTAAFTPQMDSKREVWLYDRGTAFYRGYASTGRLAVLQTAYRETDLYRRRITSEGGVVLPENANGDLKYNYTQGLALHYLLTGDDRFREAAEAVADKSLISGFTASMNAGKWTERDAGFGLLANVFAARVSDDKAAQYRTRAATIVSNALAVQGRSLNLSSAPAAKQVSAELRCFSHTATQHDISEYSAADLDGTAGTYVCSPWMSTILADGLEAYADDATGSTRTEALNAIVRLGRRLGHTDNRGTSGRPHYLLGVDGGNNPDEYNEHIGETAQLVAMAYHYSGRTDSALRSAAQYYADAFSANGDIGRVRSFNWQCRSAIATPFYLR